MNVPISEKSLLLANNNKTKENSDDNNKKKKNEKNEKQKQTLRRTTFILSFVLLIQSYLLVSVFPYARFLAMHLIPNVNEDTAGSYAGFIASSFMIGRTFSSFEWGKIADRYGRVFVIKISLVLAAIFSILFGLSSTFAMALIVRCFLGLSNGLIGPVKTMISEYTEGDKKRETQMMAIVMGMWGYGFLINPAISGYLSDPIKQYPNIEFGVVSNHILATYPFLLPNILGSILCIIAYFLVDNNLDETLSKEKRQTFSIFDILPSCCNYTKSDNAMIRNVSSWGLFKHLHTSDGMIADDSNDNYYDTSEEEEEKVAEDPPTIYSLLSRDETRQTLLVYWFFSFTVIVVDEVFPLYCMSKTSGLGITEKLIGNIMSGTGLFYICLSYFLLTKLVERYGTDKAFRIGTYLGIPLTCFIPVSLMTNKYAPEGTLNMETIIYLSTIYALIKVFGSVVFSTIAMKINGSVPAHQRATVNGLSMLGGSFAKAMGPMFGGILFSQSVVHISPPFGSVFVYCIISMLGIGQCIYVFFFQRESNDQHLKKAIASSFPNTAVVHSNNETKKDNAPITF